MSPVVQSPQRPVLRADEPGVPGTFLGESDVRFTSPSRRVAGLLAATTIGLSTAVLSLTGVASAADETSPATTSPATTSPGSGAPATVTPTAEEGAPTETPAATSAEAPAPT